MELKKRSFALLLTAIPGDSNDREWMQLWQRLWMDPGRTSTNARHSHGMFRGNGQGHVRDI